MADGDLITEDWQIEYNGLVLGGDTTPYPLISVDGLLDLPDMSSRDLQRLQRHGVLPGDDFADGRTITIVVEIATETSQAFQTALADLRTALVAGVSPELPLVFRLPPVNEGQPVRVWARPRRRKLSVDLELLYELPTVTLQFQATDPRVYDNTSRFASTPLKTAAGGMTFDATFDLTFGAVPEGGFMVAENVGGFPTPVTLRVDGPAVNPRIRHTDFDRRLRTNITLDASQWLILDSASETVLLNGEHDRTSLLSTDSVFFDLQPGVNRIEFFDFDFLIPDSAAKPEARLTATWRSANI